MLEIAADVGPSAIMATKDSRDQEALNQSGAYRNSQMLYLRRPPSTLEYPPLDVIRNCIYNCELMEMRFTWDTEKNESNRRRHGVSFETAREVFANPIMISTEN